MAKTIKFNLICDNNPVRTIEDLQNNFSIEDVLEYYDNKLLHRWLKVRGYSEELEKVSAIKSENNVEIIKALIKIFDVVTDEKKVNESIYMLEYLKERKELCNIYAQESYKTKSIISDYEAGYRQLVNDVLDNPNDDAKIKASIAELVINYDWVFALSHRELFWVLERNQAILAIMCLLMNEGSRKYYLPIENKNDDGTITVDTETNKDKKHMYDRICKIINSFGFKEKLSYYNILSFSGVTDGYWKDLEPKGKKYMVIGMNSGDFVRSSNDRGGDLSYTDVTNKFVILDGIDYKSNSSTHRLLYMEV